MNLWKFPDLATRPGKPSNKAFQCFSRVHNPPPHFDLSWKATPFSSCMERRSPYFASFVLGFFPSQLELEQCFHNWNICRHRCILCHQLHMDTSTCGDRLDTTCDLLVGLRLLFSFVQLRTYNLSSHSFLSLQLYWKWMCFCNCNIYTSEYKSGSLCGTGIYQKYRKCLKRTYFSCFSRKCILFVSLVHHSHFHLKLLKRGKHVKSNTMVFDKVSTTWKSLVYTKLVDSVKGAPLIGYSNSKYPWYLPPHYKS